MTSEFKEWVFTENVLNHIPQRVRRGFLVQQVQFLCLDAVDEYLAVGTNIGVVYWCNRKTRKIDRLRPEKSGSRITSVAVVSTVDYMIAAGDEAGIVSIFLVPKAKVVLKPDQKGSSDNVERFTMSAHTCQITCIEWSLNGQKLFTGDAKGSVVCTHVDFELNIIRYSEIINEKCRIIQLAYHQPLILLVTTAVRCLLYHQKKSSQVIQLGAEYPATACELGAVFGKHSMIKGPAVFAAQNDQRILLADANGNIQKSLNFKEPLSNDKSADAVTSQSTIMEFYRLKYHTDKSILAYCPFGLAVLDIETESLVFILKPKLQFFDVSMYKDEIFILDGYRNVRRIAVNDDPFLKVNGISQSPVGETLFSVVEKIKDEASNSLIKPMLNNLKIVDTCDKEEIISPAVEALSLSNNKCMFFENVSDEIFDDVISKNSAKIEDEIFFGEIETSLESDFANEFRKNKSLDANIDPQFDSRIKSPESEECKTDVLDVDTQDLDINVPAGMESNNNTQQYLKGGYNENDTVIEYSVRHFANEFRKNTSLDANIDPQFDSRIKSPESEECKTDVLDVDTQDLDINVPAGMESNNNTQQYLKGGYNENDTVIEYSIRPNATECNWVQFRTPSVPKWICVSNKYVYYGDKKLFVFCSKLDDLGLQWDKQISRAIRMAVSVSGDIIWKLDLGTAQSFVSGNWIPCATGVQSIAISESAAWYVKNNSVYVQNNEELFNGKHENVECSVEISKVCSHSNAIWVLSTNGSILNREGISSNNHTGVTWKKVCTPPNLDIVDISLGCKNSGWLIDRNNELYFSVNYASASPNWFHVLVDLLYRDDYFSNKLTLKNWSKSKYNHPMIAFNESSMWVSDGFHELLFVNKRFVEGLNWTNLNSHGLKIKWKLLICADYFDKKTPLWCVSKQGCLFLQHVDTNNFQAIDAPTSKPIECIAATPSSVYILTENNEIFVRTGIFLYHPKNSFWEQLKFKDLDDVKHISCSINSLWVVNNNEIFALEYSEADISNIKSKEWTKVSHTLRNVKFNQVFVGMDTSAVWALDDNNKIYFRNGIGSVSFTGTEWLYIPGICAADLAITSVAVYAVTKEGFVYRRCAISPMKLMGDCWRRIPGNLSKITGSVFGNKEGLYGISCQTNMILKDCRHTLHFTNSDDFTDRDQLTDITNDEWEIL